LFINILTIIAIVKHQRKRKVAFYRCYFWSQWTWLLRTRISAIIND